MFLGMSGMPRRINDYPVFFNGWHGVSSLGHGFVIISLFIFFFIIVEAKFVGEPFLFSERNSVGVPYFANRLSSYIVLFLQLRQPIFYSSRSLLKNRSSGFLF
jgi:heme/copper-type cytochrome/quinol oxidase subunit 1